MLRPPRGLPLAELFCACAVIFLATLFVCEFERWADYDPRSGFTPYGVRTTGSKARDAFYFDDDPRRLTP
jgi:hypothetical protein